MATITVKGIPDELYEKLKLAAKANRRSVNSEIIRRIEHSLRSHRAPAAEILERVRRLQDGFGGKTFRVEQFDQARRTGRP